MEALSIIKNLNVKCQLEYEGCHKKTKIITINQVNEDSLENNERNDASNRKMSCFMMDILKNIHFYFKFENF